jgi:hypothetical protein
VRAEDIDIGKGNQLFAILERMDERSRQIDRLWDSELGRDAPDQRMLDASRLRNELWRSRMRRVDALIDKCFR